MIWTIPFGLSLRPISRIPKKKIIMLAVVTRSNVSKNCFTVQGTLVCLGWLAVEVASMYFLGCRWRHESQGVPCRITQDQDHVQQLTKDYVCVQKHGIGRGKTFIFWNIKWWTRADPCRPGRIWILTRRVIQALSLTFMSAQLLTLVVCAIYTICFYPARDGPAPGSFGVFTVRFLRNVVDTKLSSLVDRQGLNT